MAFSPIVKWSKSPSSDVVKYVVAWTVNGVGAMSPSEVVWNSMGDADGYSHRFPFPTKSGDAVTASVKAVSRGNLTSEAVAASINLVSAVPPAPPVDVVLLPE